MPEHVIEDGDPAPGFDTVPVFKCWWRAEGYGCTPFHPDSPYLDFNTYGWLYIGGGVLAVFFVLGIMCQLVKITESKPKKVKRIDVV